MATDPRAEYESRLANRRSVVEAKGRAAEKFSNGRLLVFIAGIAVVWLIVVSKSISPWFVFAPLLGFGLLVILHGQAAETKRRADRAAAFYVKGLSRLNSTWMGGGETGARYFDDSHPYAGDLDLFGKGSLFELICTARTRSGEQFLADWLRSPAPPKEVKRRQESVDELRPRLDLREDLAVLGEDVQQQMKPESLLAWGTAPPNPVHPALRISASLLGLGSLVTGVGMLFHHPLAETFIVFALASVGFTLLLGKRVRSIMEGIDRTSHDIALLAEVLARVEREQFKSARLVELRASLEEQGISPSQQIDKLRRLIDLLDSGKNELFVLIALVIVWMPQIAFAIEAWRSRHGALLPKWLAAMGEIEALGSLAGYAWEHPADPFPEFVEGPASFDGESLGHPLIPEARCIRNDLKLGGERVGYIVSGSNMSGKSTFLRTVGTNAVLAHAGAPVRAKRLRLSPLSIGASISRQDSLQEGTSRFYAEIKRIRQIVDLTAGSQPMLYLIDEILHGTNSHDRKIGGEAIVRGLVKRNAIGLVTTHDLSLSDVATALAPKVANVHFEDHIENGRMVFDYRLHPGIVEKSNALELMRGLGLDV